MSKIGMMAVAFLGLASVAGADSAGFSPVWGKISASQGGCASGFELRHGRAWSYAHKKNMKLPETGICINVTASRIAERGDDQGPDVLTLPQRCLRVDEEGPIETRRQLLYHLSKLYAVNLWTKERSYEEVMSAKSITLVKVRSMFCDGINQKLDYAQQAPAN
jgi:hypothetical protein